MNANTSVGLGYSELIDSHRIGLQMEKGFLTVSLGPAWGMRASSLPIPANPLFSFTLWASNMEMMGVGIQQEAGWIRAQKECLKQEGDTQKDESPQTNSL